MDDIKIIVWIIIGLIYLFTRKKKADAANRKPARSEEQETDSQPMPAPKTFEELLREIEGTKSTAPAQRMERWPEPKPVVVDYDENLGEEEQDLEDVAGDSKKEDSIYKTYEDAKAQAFYRPSLEETIKLEDTIVRFKQFEGYEQEPRKSEFHDFLLELRDPKGFKKAFIMSEILRPKFRQ